MKTYGIFGAIVAFTLVEAYAVLAGISKHKKRMKKILNREFGRP